MRISSVQKHHLQQLNGTFVLLTLSVFHSCLHLPQIWPHIRKGCCRITVTFDPSCSHCDRSDTSLYARHFRSLLPSQSDGSRQAQPWRAFKGRREGGSPRCPLVPGTLASKGFSTLPARPSPRPEITSLSTVSFRTR